MIGLNNWERRIGGNVVTDTERTLWLMLNINIFQPGLFDVPVLPQKRAIQ
jgi:hypothetical protein